MRTLNCEREKFIPFACYNKYCMIYEDDYRSLEKFLKDL